MSLAVWYAARVIGSSNRLGESTSAAREGSPVSMAVCCWSPVPRSETHAIAAMMPTATTPSTTFCLLIDFNDLPFRRMTYARNDCFQNKEHFAFFFVVEF